MSAALPQGPLVAAQVSGVHKRPDTCPDVRPPQTPA
jgi:hypothetical protein